MREAVGIVGAGAVAQTLGRALVGRGVQVVALASRDVHRAAAAATYIGGGVRVVDLTDIPTHATHVLVSTADTAVAPVADTLAGVMMHGIVLHTCAACGLAPLAPLHAKGLSCGVFHPLQTFPQSDGPEALAGVSFAVCGDSDAVVWAQELARLVGGHALTIDPDALPIYHAGAAVASNGMAAILDSALAMFDAAGISRSEALAALGPLCRRSLDNLLGRGPESALTGPIARGDAGTVRAHVAVLKARAPAQLPIYRAMARTLIDIVARRGASPATLKELSQAIE